VLEWELTDYTSNRASPRRACWGGRQVGACSVDFLFYFEDKNKFLFFPEEFFSRLGEPEQSHESVIREREVKKGGKKGVDRVTLVVL
jgi:hypothetical protein